MKESFKKVDSNNDGVLTKEEIEKAFKRIHGADYDQKEIDDLILKADVDKDGKINY